MSTGQTLHTVMSDCGRHGVRNMHTSGGSVLDAVSNALPVRPGSCEPPPPASQAQAQRQKMPLCKPSHGACGIHGLDLVLSAAATANRSVIQYQHTSSNKKVFQWQLLARSCTWPCYWTGPQSSGDVVAVDPCSSAGSQSTDHQLSPAPAADGSSTKCRWKA